MKRIFSTKPFKNRLFASYAVVGFCVVLVFGALLIGTSSRLNRETEVYHQQQLHNANLSELEQILNRVDQLATQVISNNELLNFFVLLSTDATTRNYISPKTCWTASAPNPSSPASTARTRLPRASASTTRRAISSPTGPL
jgi:hypothetical protein